MTTRADEFKSNPHLNIYFAGAIRGGRDDAALYHEMIQFLGTFGAVLTEHVGDTALTAEGDDGPNDRAIHDRDMAWLRACDLVVAEVTQPSLGVGYELGFACALHKPALALYRPQPGKHLSAMIAGSAQIVVAEYATIVQAREILRPFLADAAAALGRKAGG
ncbi:MAG: nucleoside 2-deoxyribosyltransferase [Desulfatitalea sp.]|nr:nucleoside 2-deoxyribosyltransferase [Desulfatitalea sp.]